MMPDPDVLSLFVGFAVGVISYLLIAHSWLLFGCVAISMPITYFVSVSSGTPTHIENLVALDVGVGAVIGMALSIGVAITRRRLRAAGPDIDTTSSSEENL